MTFRVLGPHKRGRFAPEAWGHLIALSGSGLLSSAELEQLIERALQQIDGRIAIDDIRALMEGVGSGAVSAPFTDAMKADCVIVIGARGIMHVALMCERCELVREQLEALTVDGGEAARVGATL